MKKILRIAQLELSTLFYSPIAWVIIIIFIFQSGYTFINALEVYQKGVFLGRMDYRNFTAILFSSESPDIGLFASVQKNLFLYIPLLTMGLISKELSSGSIKLLLSSPVRNREIVLGKFLSMMFFGLIPGAFLVLLMIIGTYAVPSMNVAMIMTAILGFYLLLCAYAAIGLFLSSLSSYQVIVAIGTLVVLAILNYVGLLGQKMDFVRDLTYFLSIAGRAEVFKYGLIGSKDVIYFIVIIVFFLSLTIIRLQAGRDSKPTYIKAGRYGLLITAMLLVIYVSSRPVFSFYADTTATRLNTLTENSQQIIRKIDKPVKITTYVNELDMYHYYFGMPNRRNEDLSRFEQYRRFLPEIEFKYVYYYDVAPNNIIHKRNKGLDDEQLARKVAVSDDNDFDMFLPPAEIRKIIDLKEEKYSFVRQIEYNGKKTFLRLYNDNEVFPGEAEISAALARLINKSPVVGFMSGNEERSLNNGKDGSYLFAMKEKTYRASLINQGFDVIDIPADAAIPDSLDVLVLADPGTALSETTLSGIKQYITKGGNMLIAADTGKQAIVNPLFSDLGIKLTSRVLTEKTENYAPELIFSNVSDKADGLDKNFAEIRKDSLKVSMLGVSPLTYQDGGSFSIQPFLTYRDTINLALSLTRTVNNKQQRILVTGDADVLSNGELGRFRVGNGDLCLGMFRWLSNSQFPIDVSRPETPDNKLIISRSQIAALKNVLLFVIPILLLIWGAFILIRRRRR
jgi:ABC-2 type transport system permease protein